MHDLTGFERDLVYVIAGEGGLKGLVIKERIRQYYEKEIYDGRLYPALDKLVNKGLVRKQRRDDRTNEYRLTKRGEHVVRFRREWENELEEEIRGTEAE